MPKLAIASLSQFAFALLIGVTGLFLTMTLAGVEKSPNMDINIRVSIAMYLVVLFLGGLTFFVPGALSSFCTALLFRRSPLRPRWTLFLLSAAIAFGCFYLVLTVREFFMRVRLNLFDGFVWHPSGVLPVMALYISPVAFGLAALVTRALINRMFVKNAKKAEQGAAANP